jgi:hypothetical protein
MNPEEELMGLDAIVEALVADETLTDEQRMAAIDRVCDGSVTIERERCVYANQRLLRDCRERRAAAAPASGGPAAPVHQESLRQMLEEIRAMDRRQGELDRQAEVERRWRAAQS